ncbi:dTMP kinase [Notoacmeibacter sp. MSK16QG-6]|uniref:dTMP kinase n=1 Tax=Notoacmeibacter sp. MSK16QG-6 TaxID=2957982 RepID=UPI0020A2283C|nr:dTMP kinase [Notoacmeibacter sp. MSK16QG-6]MCP1200745.1 dTMP kinase [Notoacmeibacter sp. MSK16QG-6]
MEHRGFFLTFEGGEGSGKSTQMRCLARTMQRAGRSVRVTREPGGTPAAEALRAALLSGEAKSLGPLAEACLFASARADHVRQLIRPALRQGQDVLCDRFIDSTRAYQGGAGVSGEELDLLEKLALGDLKPDLTLLLDLDVEEGMDRADTRRRSEQPDRFEADRMQDQEKRRQAFLQMANDEPDRFSIIDASQTVDRVEKAVAAIVTERLGIDLSPVAKQSSSL